MQGLRANPSRIDSKYRRRLSYAPLAVKRTFEGGNPLKVGTVTVRNNKTLDFLLTYNIIIASYFLGPLRRPLDPPELNRSPKRQFIASETEAAPRTQVVYTSTTGDHIRDP